MRPIEFRGKGRYNGTWYEGFYVENLYDYSTEFLLYDVIVDIDSDVHEIDPATLGQFTGLTDSNGTKIWDGDFVKIPPLFECCLVLWNEHVNAFQLGYFGMQKGTAIGGRITMTMYAHDSHRMYVIGNIHDNPELLKEVQP